uniref:Uncharacterized protein n=1 Tax=Romanomermis culicivorax TaxID=13658 RepID=A0A915IF85_ROMCU
MVHLRKLFQTFMVNAFLKIIYCGLNHSFEELIEDQLPDDGNMTFIRPVRGVDKYTNTIRFNIPDLTVMHKFGFSMNERDLTPDEMKRHLSDMMVVEKHGDKHSITLKNDEKRAGGEENENSEKYGAALSVGTKFGIDANAEFIKKEGHRWENANTSTLEQLSDMNSDDRNHVKYEFVGSKLVPKAVKVALLHKNDLKKDVSISYKPADTFQELKKDFDEYK